MSRFEAGLMILVIVCGPLGCSSGGHPRRPPADAASPGPDAGGDTATEPVTASTPFSAVAPAVYVAKVKNILVGLPPTDDEVQRSTADPAALEGARSTAGCSCRSTSRR